MTFSKALFIAESDMQFEQKGVSRLGKHSMSKYTSKGQRDAYSGREHTGLKVSGIDI